MVEAEVRAIHMGILLAKLKSFRKVNFETDSFSAIRLIKEGCPSLHPLFNLVSDVQSLLVLEKDSSVEHIFREANEGANCNIRFCD